MFKLEEIPHSQPDGYERDYQKNLHMPPNVEWSRNGPKSIPWHISKRLPKTKQSRLTLSLKTVYTRIWTWWESCCTRTKKQRSTNNQPKLRYGTVRRPWERPATAANGQKRHCLPATSTSYDGDPKCYAKKRRSRLPMHQFLRECQVFFKCHIFSATINCNRMLCHFFRFSNKQTRSFRVSGKSSCRFFHGLISAHQAKVSPYCP